MPASLLLGPAARRSIIARTFVDPAREFYLRELVRLTGLAPRTVNQEVDRLVDADLLTERRSGNRRYLRANERHPLFAPVREIVLKTAGLADVLRDALGIEGIEFAVVFGSIASHAPRAGSDVDLLVVGRIGLRETARRLQPARDLLGREINPVVWTRAEYTRRVRARDHFLMSLRDGPLVSIVGTMPNDA